MNTIYSNSSASIELKSVGVVFKDISKGNTISDTTILFDNLKAEKQGFEKLKSTAMELGADYTIAVLPTLKDGASSLCGQAATVSRTQDEINAKDFTNSTVLTDYGCGSSTLVHELGHVMGLAHGDIVATASGNNAHKNGLNTYSKGWGVIVSIVTKNTDSSDEKLEAGEFGTIMSGNYVKYWTNTTGSGVKVPLFSNPSIRDTRCGIDSNGNGLVCGSASNGDAARALRENVAAYARHQTVDVHALSYLSGEFANCIVAQYPHDTTTNDHDIDKISSLDCPSKNIRTVYGIQNITGLISGSTIPDIDLRNNFIVGLGALQPMHKDAVIDLTGNDVADCHQMQILKTSHPNTKLPAGCFNTAAVTQYL
ncbi:MAG: hypothetical protein EOO68_31725 [Moraxellaceae bacterium]|nr:MAG: hypothetical protein EOO68_31725 [Moraxellaceae bacterium]